MQSARTKAWRLVFGLTSRMDLYIASVWREIAQEGVMGALERRPWRRRATLKWVSSPHAIPQLWCVPCSETPLSVLYRAVYGVLTGEAADLLHGEVLLSRFGLRMRRIDIGRWVSWVGRSLDLVALCEVCIRKTWDQLGKC